MNSLQEFASSLSNETKWHADNDHNSSSLPLKAGSLSMIYENGNLRYLSIGNHEVIRMIYGAVRDKEWQTIEPIISGEEIDILPDSFRIRYHCQYKSGEINFSSEYTIEGNADNSLIFSFEGETVNSFEKNRIGICVLHPVEEYAGGNCIIIHGNGESESLIFPVEISPHQPFSDIQSMKWKFCNHNCTLDFYGESFETEDQRNWTDASYKTYSTLLSRPFPVRLEKGEKINQKIEFSVEGDFKLKGVTNDEILISVNRDKTFSLPKIGIGQTTRPVPLTDNEIEIIKKLRFDHYRTDLFLFSADWKEKAEIAAREAAAIQIPLELALFFDNDFINQISGFIVWIVVTNPDIALITVFHRTQPTAPAKLLNMIVPMLREVLPGIKTGSGTNADFVRLNRNRDVSPVVDYLSYSIQPQEHARDNSTLTENLKAQSYTVETAKKFAEGREIWISPVTIQRRFNANIANYELQSQRPDCPPQVDSRLMSLFGACWTAGSLKYLFESDIKGVTYFETVGERGICQGDHPSRWPEQFKSSKGMLFPLYHVFRYILRDTSFKLISSTSSHPLKVESLLLSDGNQIKLILVNFTSIQQKVCFDGYFADYSFIIKQLDADSFSDSVSRNDWIETAGQTDISLNKALLLKPFSVNFIDRKI